MGAVEENGTTKSTTNAAATIGIHNADDATNTWYPVDSPM